MRQEIIQLLTEKDEEFLNLLIRIGTKKNIAKLLVYLANMTEATSREIERGADMRQPEVSAAAKYMMEQGWIQCYNSSAKTKTRPNKVYKLVQPIPKIIDCIEKEKKDEMNSTLALVRKIRDFA